MVNNPTNIIKNINSIRKPNIKIYGELELLVSNSGKTYLALKIEDNDVEPYTTFLSDNIGKDFINNQRIRDKNEYHLTVINYADYSQVLNQHPKELEDIKSNLGKKFKIEISGIGTAKNQEKEAQAWFLVCESEKLQELRKNVNLNNYDFHITLAFDKSDVFNQPKNKESIVYVMPENKEKKNSV